MQRSTSHDSYIRHKGSVLLMGIEGTNGDAGSPNLHCMRSMVTGEPEADSHPNSAYQLKVYSPSISLAKKFDKKMEREATIRRPMDISSGGKAFDENVEKKKGFLAHINSVVNILLMLTLALVAATYGFPLASKASLSLGDPWMQVITAGSTIAIITSIILACLGSRLKGRKSIQGAGFQIVKWLILIYCLFLGTALCIFLHFALMISNAVAWTFGAIIYFAILCLWGLFYYVDHPEIMKGMRNDRVEDGTFSPPV